MTAPVAAERLLVDRQVTLSVTLLDGYGEPEDAAGAVTVDITAEDENPVITGGATSNPAGTGTYTYALAAGANADLELLTAVWKDGGTARLTTKHEIVGGFYFSKAEVEADGRLTSSISDAARFRRVRDEVEREFERITECAWVPRYRRVRVDGSGRSTLLLDSPRIWAPRTVRSVRVASGATTYTEFTATELAAIECKEWGDLIIREGVTSWAAGTQNLVLEVEHGYDRPTEDLKRAAITRFVQRWKHPQLVDLSQFDRMTTVDGGSVETGGDPTLEMEQRDVLRVVRAHSSRIAL